MARSLKSYQNEDERKAAIARRLDSETYGLGYWAARDAQLAREHAERRKALNKTLQV